MNKLILTLLLVLVAFPAFAAKEKESVYDRVIRTGTIRCGYAMWNPIFYKDMETGQFGGIAYDLMEAVGKRMHFKIEWAEEVTWGGLVEGLITNRYDMFCVGMYMNAARSQRMDFTVPWFYSPSYVAVRSDENRLSKNDDLNDPAYTISILEGEANGIAARQQFPLAKIHAIPQMSDYPQVYEEVKSGKADATIMEPATFLEYNESNPGVLRMLNKNPVNVFPVVFGLPQNDMAFKVMMNAVLTELTNEGLVDQVLSQHEKRPGLFLRIAKPYEVPK